MVCNSGDILDKSVQRTANVDHLQKVDRVLAELGIKMYTITGNHDMDSPTWLEVLFPEDKRSIHGGIIPVDNKVEDYEGVLIGGLPGHDASELLKTLEDDSIKKPDIVLWHGAVNGLGNMNFGEVDYKELVEACPENVMAVLLGDLHFHQYEMVNGVLIGYPGSTDLCSVAESDDKMLGHFSLDQSDRTIEILEPIKFKSTPLITVKLEGELGDKKKEKILKQAMADVSNTDFSLVRLIYDQENMRSANVLAATLPAENCIVRRKLISDIAQKVEQRNTDDTVMMTTPTNMVDAYIKPGDMEYDTAKSLSTKGTDPAVVLEHFINQHAPTRIKSL